MLKMSNDSYDRAYSKLLQAKSIATVLLDNHNYKCAGYDEPFIDNVDMGNLMWAIADLADEANNKLDKLELKEDANHA